MNADVRLVLVFFLSNADVLYLGTIAMMESQIETMKNNIESLKGSKIAKEKKKEKKKEKAPVASTSKPPPKQTTKAPSKKKTKKNVTDDDVLTFEQKKDLSESIGKLDGARLERVIQIIHEGVPEIRDVSSSFFNLSYTLSTVAQLALIMHTSTTEHRGNRAGD